MFMLEYRHASKIGDYLFIQCVCQTLLVTFSYLKPREQGRGWTSLRQTFPFAFSECTVFPPIHP